ncbi:MAG: hypothetical protein AB7V77_01625 [Candidatus Woesearchaeota archaeon]
MVEFKKAIKDSYKYVKRKLAPKNVWENCRYYYEKPPTLGGLVTEDRFWWVTGTALAYAVPQVLARALVEVPDFQSLSHVISNSSFYVANLYAFYKLHKNDELIPYPWARDLTVLFLGGLVGYNLVQDYKQGIADLTPGDFKNKMLLCQDVYLYATNFMSDCTAGILNKTTIPTLTTAITAYLFKEELDKE